MKTFIQLSSAAPLDHPPAIPFPAATALPVWVLVLLLICRELGFGNLLKSFQDGRLKSSESQSSLTEKVVIQVLEEHSKLTLAVERLTQRVDQLTEETKTSNAYLEILAQKAPVVENAPVVGRSCVSAFSTMSAFGED